MGLGVAGLAGLECAHLQGASSLFPQILVECSPRAAQSYVLEFTGEPHTGDLRLPGAHIAQAQASRHNVRLTHRHRYTALCRTEKHPAARTGPPSPGPEGTKEAPAVWNRKDE